MNRFLRASLSFAWLELKALRFYPVNGALQVVRSFVSVGIWFFVSLFLKEFAAPDLAEYGGDFVAYMVIGVLFFQNASSILALPQQSLTSAYWDKRLEVYHSRRHGIWAFIVGRLMWLFVYDGVIMIAVLAVGLLGAGVKLSPDMPLLPALSFYVVFVLTSFGIGLIGASNFVFLEIKQGREPVTWLVDVLVPATHLCPARHPSGDDQRHGLWQLGHAEHVPCAAGILHRGARRRRLVARQGAASG